jgi:polyferredoxin
LPIGNFVSSIEQYFVLAPYTWKSASSEIWATRQLRLGSNLFHVGVLSLLGGHLAGLFTPLWVFELLRVTPRMIGYTTVLLALIGVFLFLIFTRSPVETTLLRAPGQLFQQMPDGHFSNLYTIRVVNKTSREIPIQLKLENLKGDLQVMGRDIVVPPQKSAETSVLIDLDLAVMKPGTTPLVVGVYSNGRRLETLKTGFIGQSQCFVAG